MKQEKIMCSAIWIKEDLLKMMHRPTNIEYGVVFTGYRHCDCLELISLFYTKRELLQFERVQGFLTTKKRFVDRVEARIIAENANQLLDGCSKGNQLYSEDVWLINYEEREDK